jgi:diadenosine tetraphosphate (Ap4A) HIT family hydrolase
MTQSCPAPGTERSTRGKGARHSAMRTCVQVALVTVVECPLVLAPETPVTACPLWIVAVNRNQNLLGKTVLVVNRPVESVTALRPDEWADLHRQIARVTVALDELFAPDQYNHAFLMNADAHVHMHVVPRYRAVRSWGGQVFSDSHFGSLFGTEQRVLVQRALAPARRCNPNALRLRYLRSGVWPGDPPPIPKWTMHPGRATPTRVTTRSTLPVTIAASSKEC